MEAFEKWWNKDQSDKDFSKECGGRELDPKIQLDKLASTCWRAALAWFLKEHSYDLSYDKYWIVESVEKELET